jgi:hypothetical protein
MLRRSTGAGISGFVTLLTLLRIGIIKRGHCRL